MFVIARRRGRESPDTPPLRTDDHMQLPGRLVVEVGVSRSWQVCGTPEAPEFTGSVSSVQLPPPSVLRKTPESAPPATKMLPFSGSYASRLGCGYPWNAP